MVPKLFQFLFPNVFLLQFYLLQFPIFLQRKLLEEYRNVAIYDESIMVDLGKKIIEYCRLQRDPDYQQLVVYEMRRMFNNELIADPSTETKEMLDLIKGQKLLGDAISELRVNFLNGDDSDKTYDEVLDMIENDLREFSPEQILLNDKVRKMINKCDIYGPLYNGRKYTKEDLNKEELAQLERELNNDTDECRLHFKSLGIHE